MPPVGRRLRAAGWGAEREKRARQREVLRRGVRTLWRLLHLKRWERVAETKHRSLLPRGAERLHRRLQAQT